MSLAGTIASRTQTECHTKAHQIATSSATASLVFAFQPGDGIRSVPAIAHNFNLPAQSADLHIWPHSLLFQCTNSLPFLLTVRAKLALLPLSGRLTLRGPLASSPKITFRLTCIKSIEALQWFNKMLSKLA